MVNQKAINVRSHDPCGVRIRRKKQVANLVRNNDAQQIADRQALPHRHVCDGFDQHWRHRATDAAKPRSPAGRRGFAERPRRRRWISGVSESGQAAAAVGSAAACGPASHVTDTPIRP
jgi:hypothetical protein